MYCYLLSTQVKIKFFVRGSENTSLKGLNDISSLNCWFSSYSISTRGFLMVCFFWGKSFHAAGSQERSIDNSLASTKVFGLTALISFLTCAYLCLIVPSVAQWWSITLLCNIFYLQENDKISRIQSNENRVLSNGMVYADTFDQILCYQLSNKLAYDCRKWVSVLQFSCFLWTR